ncbi:hypothetical protein AWB80_01259 [Caballeronia pedi]|uniref:Uncharacterized protein n=1 Tax=Caballeronia pedi TaxID=1777141 RepID=A0A157ZT62_9BURK|nr:hypothetical protein AWB80_01259 [Caballeronia pedi]
MADRVSKPVLVRLQDYLAITRICVRRRMEVSRTQARKAKQCSKTGGAVFRVSRTWRRMHRRLLRYYRGAPRKVALMKRFFSKKPVKRVASNLQFLDCCGQACQWHGRRRRIARSIEALFERLGSRLHLPCRVSNAFDGSRLLGLALSLSHVLCCRNSQTSFLLARLVECSSVTILRPTRIRQMTGGRH